MSLLMCQVGKIGGCTISRLNHFGTLCCLDIAHSTHRQAINSFIGHRLHLVAYEGGVCLPATTNTQ